MHSLVIWTSFYCYLQKICPWFNKWLLSVFFCWSQCSCHLFVIRFFIGKWSSQWVIWAGCSPKIIWASLAVLSVAFLPTWLGALQKQILLFWVWILFIVVWISYTNGCLRFCCTIACINSWNSEKLVHLLYLIVSITDRTNLIDFNSSYFN